MVMMPNRVAIAVGCALLIASPLALWWRELLVQRAGSPAFAPPWALALLPWGSLACFALGWLTVGAGLRPWGSSTYGTVLAAGLYWLIGVFFATTFNVSLGLRDLSSAPALLLIAFFWPMQVAQVLGLFGMSFN